MAAIITRHTEEIAALKASTAPLEFSELRDSIHPLRNWKDLTSSHQTLYWSLQGLKVDVEALAVTTAGVSLLGAELIRSPLASLVGSGAGLFWQWALGAVDGRRVLGPLVRSIVPDSESQQFEINKLKDESTRHDVRISGHADSFRTLDRTTGTLRDTVGRARRFAESAVTKVERTSTSMGRQVGALRGDLGRARQVADRALVRADSAHRRIDGTDTARRNQRANVAAVGTSQAGGPDPRRLREAGDQIRQLETRVNSLVRALS
ncbi:hypothetical protein J7E90_04575 [Streptomyces sp. ISL-111]|uniref:hypothetical protein n=1 Tax=Streptomyces sp. ISL-111 TaxID=2819175 RepID=UPI001BEB9ABB|nr:hypothetical protein [Streptomyces sp. ISL-111]MBT2376662.1 hypothetical protein [Streptomyces sp. ISL-111]